jgi:hypothetical protein
VREIDAALEQGIDLLHRDASEDGDRHASIRTVFEHSWALLKPRERRALRRLSVCRGGFTLEAARAVGEIELPVLLALVNKSFLRRDGAGRYTRHPLVRQFTADRAAAHPGEEAAARSRHANYYLRHVAPRVDTFHQPRGAIVMHDVALDLENVVRAWRWASRTGAEAPLASAVRSLGQFCWARGRFDVMDELYIYTLAHADAAPGSLLQGRLLVGLGVPASWGDRGVDRRESIETGIRILEQTGVGDDLAFAYRTLGIAHYKVRDWLGAENAYAATASEYERLGRTLTDVDQASAAGYGTSSDCMARGLGAQGIHYANEALFRADGGPRDPPTADVRTSRGRLTAVHRRRVPGVPAGLARRRPRRAPDPLRPDVRTERDAPRRALLPAARVGQAVQPAGRVRRLESARRLRALHGHGPLSPSRPAGGTPGGPGGRGIQLLGTDRPR